MMIRLHAVHFSRLGLKPFGLLLGIPSFNLWFPFTSVVKFDTQKISRYRNILFLSIPRFFFYHGAFGFLFVYRDYSLTS